MNHQNKTSENLFLYRVNSKIIRVSSFAFIAAALVVSGFFAPQQAFAAATVLPASGGNNISIDTTSAPGGSRTYKTLTGPSISDNGDIAVGTHTISLPTGWEFNAWSMITVTPFNNIGLDSTSIIPSATSFSFVVIGKSTVAGFVGFSGIQVRPTGTTPSTGNMTYSGAGIVGVDGNTNFGTLSTVAGTVTKLAFTTQPGGAVYGSLLSSQPVVVTRDQFNNNSTSGLIETEMVSLSLIGTGALQGTASLDIGTSAGNGTVTFTDLKVGGVGAVGIKGLTASAAGLTSAVSGNFVISQKPLTATVTVNSKPYDGNNSAVITNVALNSVEPGDVVTVDNQGTATFASSNANTGIVVTSNGVTITGAHAGNYSFDGTATGSADITAKPITVTPTAGQTKVYGSADLTFAYTFNPVLISPDTFSGALSRVAGEDAGTYAYSIGNLSAGSNYLLTLVPETFEITQKTLNVTAVGVNKVYNANTTATVTLSDDRVLGDEITLGYAATFTDSKNVGTNKPVSVTGIAITGGADAGNYTLGNTTAATTANIAAKPLTVSFTTNANKTYSGSVTAAITSRSLDGVIGIEDVNVTGGSATFADKHVGNNKTVTATGFTLTGVDSGNYTIGTINTTTGNVIKRPLAITAVTDNKVYDGTADSDGVPTITSPNSPPIVGTDVANFVQVYDNKNVGTIKTLTPSGTVIDGNGGANYSYTFVMDATGVITTKSINVTAQPDTKIYDGTVSSDEAPIVDALEIGDAVGTPPTQEFDTKDVWVNKVLTASGLVINDGNSGANYDIFYVNNGTGIINAKGLTVSGATTNSKIYDGNEVATVNFVSATLGGVIPGEEALVSLDSTGYSAEFDNKNVGTGKTVTVSGLTLDGVGMGNYLLTQPILNDGVITSRILTVTAEGSEKIYDGNNDATGIVTLSDDRIFGDNLTLTHTATFDGPNGKNVGMEKPVSVSDIAITGGDDENNYVLGNDTTSTDADITAKPITATLTAADKPYDGNDSATITGVKLDGVVEGDDVVPDFSSAEAAFEDANADEDKDVDAEGVVLTGIDAFNYNYDGTATGNADITPLEITGSFTADNKVYDGTMAATILERFLTGVLPQDDGNVVLTGGTAEFTDPNVGTDIIVIEIVAMTLTGSAAGNYELTGVVSTEADIIKAPLTITADDKGRVYGDENPELTASYDGFVNEEDENVFDTSVELSTIADEISPVGTYEITASGATATNYEITHNNGTLTVTPAPIDIIPNEGQGKIYGESDEEIIYEASGFKNDENKSIFDGALGRDPGENTGEYLINEGGLNVGGNYYIDSFFDIFYTIEQRELTVAAVTDTKVYDGNTTSSQTPLITEGELQFNDEANFTQSYNTKDVGTGKTLIPAGIVNDGNGGGNYDVNFVNNTTGVITAKLITITPDAGQSKVYGQDDSNFTYTHHPTLIDVDIDLIIGALSRAEGENVGTYAYNLGSLTAGGNYLLILGGAEIFEILKATPVITWDDPEDIVYGTALNENQLNAETDVEGEFIYTPAEGTVLNAGEDQELSVTFTPDDAANYNGVTQEVFITVEPATLFVEADNQTKEYGDDDPVLTYDFEGLVNGDTNSVFSGGLARDPGEDVGEYNIKKGILSAGSNYEIDFDSGTLTIEDTVAPAIIFHTPSFNALNISPATAIVITFSEPVIVEEGDVSFSPMISGGFVITNSGTSVATITPNNPLNDNTTYTITLDGVADINGLSLPTYSNIKFTTATNYSINLNANASGWNLISLPVIPSNTAITAVLGSAADNIDAVWTYDPNDPNAVNGWLVFVPGNPEGTNNLTLMTTGFGYWVSVIDDTNLFGSGTLLIAGPTPPPSRSLQPGWNLIGYYQLPNEDSSEPDDAFVSLGGSYTGLWGFDNTTGFFNSVTTIDPGDAFWISLSSAKTYTPSNISGEN